MNSAAARAFPAIFAAGLLFFGCVIRSKIVVDSTLIPRFLPVVLILLVFSLSRNFRRLKTPFGFFIPLFFLFYLWNLVSAAWSVAPEEALMQAQMVFLGLSVFLTVTALLEHDSLFERTFIRIFQVVLLFSFGIGFYKMSLLPFYDPYKIISLCANNNLYTGFLLLSLSLTLAGYSMQTGFWRYLSVLCGILALFFIVIVQSRAAYLGLFVASVVSFVLLILRYRSHFSRRNILTGMMALILLLAGVVAFYHSLDATRKNYFLSKVPVWQYFRSYPQPDADSIFKMRSALRASNAQSGEFDFSESYYENANLRVIFWKKSLCLMGKHPLTGVGAGNWRLNIPACAEPPNPGHTLRNFTYSQPHNEWIAILSELGLIGLILAVAVLIGPVFTTLHTVTGRGHPVPVRAVFYMAFLMGFYLFSCFDFPFRRVEHTIILFTVMAFMVRLSFLHHRKIRFSRFSAFAVKATPAILILSALTGMARLSGEYYTLKMFRAEGKDPVRVVRYSREASNPFYRITPNTLPLAWFEGVAQQRLGEPDSALTCFQNALRSAPFEVRVLNDEAVALFSIQRTTEAKAGFRYALGIDPFFDDARFNLAALFYFEGNLDSALYHAGKCRDGRKRKEVLEEIRMAPPYPQ